jgi:asparagine synthase (glutamine-hydrolysing)
LSGFYGWLGPDPSESTVAGTELFEGAELTAAICGNVRFGDAHLAALARERGAACALAQGYLVKRHAILQDLKGSFALAVLERHGTGLLAVDRTGTQPLYYTTRDSCLRFGTTLDAFAAMPGLRLNASFQAIYEYLYFHVVPGPDTIYEGCKRLLPGTFLAWDGGKREPTPYWQIRFTETSRRPFADLKASFRELLEAGVADAVRDGGKVGAFLSGGTDSSTVAGMLGRVTGEPAATYSIGFDAQGYDEMAYARIAARHFGTSHHEYYVTPHDVVAAIPLVAHAHSQPFGNSSAVPTYYCAKLAREDGVHTLLAGDGGDEIFGGNERYAKQYIYSLYSDLPDAMKKGLIEPLAFMFGEQRPILGKARRYISNASLPMPARYDNYNLVEHFGLGTIFTPDFLAAIDPAAPPRRMAEVYWSQQAESMINRMLGFDLKYTLADNDLPKVVQACAAAGVAVRFPLLDDALVDFSASLAPRLKVRRTRLRYFFKQALRDFLPQEIIRKKKHGFGLPFGLWVRQHDALRQMAFDSLNDLKGRQIVRPEFIDRLCSRHIDEHAKYYGTMIWILMMLELWFKRLGAETRDGARQAGRTEKVA